MSLFLKFMSDERGASAIEYCLIGGLIALAIVASTRLIGSSVRDQLLMPAANGLGG